MEPLGAIIGAAGTVFGIVIGFLTFNRNRDKDVKTDATRNAIIETKLDNINSTVNMTAVDLKASDERWNSRWTSLSTEVARIDESNKSLHKRVDGLENKEEK